MEEKKISVVLANPEEISQVVTVVTAMNDLLSSKINEHMLRDAYGNPFGMVLIREADLYDDTEANIEVCELAGLLAQAMIEPDILTEYEQGLLDEHHADIKCGTFVCGDVEYEVVDYTPVKGGSNDKG